MVDIKSKVYLLKLAYLVIKVTVWEMVAAQWLNTVAVFLVKCNNLQLLSTVSPLANELFRGILSRELTCFTECMSVSFTTHV